MLAYNNGDLDGTRKIGSAKKRPSVKQNFFLKKLLWLVLRPSRDAAKNIAGQSLAKQRQETRQLRNKDQTDTSQ